jgi:hypothetical protein
MLSLALNVSLILKMVYEGEEVHNNNNSCLKNERGTSIAARARARARARADFHKSRVVMSTTSSLSNSTCTDLTRGNNRIINLDQ